MVVERERGEIMIPERYLGVERAAEMLLHAYNYVRDTFPGHTEAADLLWAKYKEVKVTRQSRTLLATLFLTAGLIMCLPPTLAAQEPEKEKGVGRCPVFGQIFGIDPLAGTMLVKTPSGSIESLWFEKTNVFRAVTFDSSSKASSVSIDANEVSSGDWICARTGANEKHAEIVLVAARQEIQNRQRETLTRWLNGSIFGTVIELQPENKNLMLEYRDAGEVKKVLVTTSDTTRFNRYLWDGTELGEIAAASWAQVRVGERMYVHGTISADGESLDATSVICGDLQAIAGTIGTINPLDETLRLNELITGQDVTVHIGPGDLRLISLGPQGSTNILQAIDFGDIREGDSVIVLARQSESEAAKINGAVLIVNFGEPTPQGVSQQVTWKLVPMMLGLPRETAARQ
jgi:hypothetical protein